MQILKGTSLTQRLNPLPDDEILDWSKLKQIADKFLTLYSIDTHFDASTTDSF